MSLKGYEYGGFNPMDGNDDGYGNFGGNEPSSATKKENGSTRDKLAITPLTCKQFLEAKVEQQDTFKVDDKELHNVIFVGNVEQVENATTQRRYVINDGTGSIECKQFVESAGSAGQQEIAVNTYVRIVGIARIYGGVRTITIHKIFPIVVSLFSFVLLLLLC
jgi:replication factor A2